MAVSVLAAILLFLLYIVIFAFSSQNAQQSGGVSYQLTEKCVEMVHSLSGQNWSNSFVKELIIQFEHPLRKLAHFTEYALMGSLVYVMWRPWKRRGKEFFLLVTLWVLLSAMGDEFHQTFVPGRDGNAYDVLLDTCGGMFGIWCCVILERIPAIKRVFL